MRAQKVTQLIELSSERAVSAIATEEEITSGFYSILI
jgi:hypothetical protein